MADSQYLVKLFEDLYLLEEQAKNLYDEYLLTLSDPEATKIITGIRDDEIRHIEIARKLQEIIKQ